MSQALLLLAAIMLYSLAGFCLLLAIEKCLYHGKPPKFYQGLPAALCQSIWPISLTVVACIGIAKLLKIRLQIAGSKRETPD